MFQTTALYAALALFALGLIFKISGWFRYTAGIDAAGIGTSRRILAALGGGFATVISRDSGKLLRALVADVLLQRRLFRQGWLRWLAHFCIFVGFSALFLMHAVAKYTTSIAFPAYLPTLNPYLFLRDLFGAVVLLGLALALMRRFKRKAQVAPTKAGDVYALAVVAVIVLSGVILEGAKIISYSAYQEMVESYAGGESVARLKALEAYWVKDFAVVSPNMRGPFDAAMLGQGKELHGESCGECHARAQWGFLGYATARAMGPVALAADRVNLRGILLVVHYLSCFLGLALLPFSKMLHIFTSPMTLLVNSVLSESQANPANTATRQMLELDACTHCGLCTEHCAVAIAFEEIPNVNILPSEKIASMKKVAAGRELSSSSCAKIQQGMFLCTNCYRCTSVCPVGIDLQGLWFSIRERLLLRQIPEFLLLSPFSLYRGLKQTDLDPLLYQQPLDVTRKVIVDSCRPAVIANRALPLHPGSLGNMDGVPLATPLSTLKQCYQCMTCSNACPVVQNYPNASEVLGLLPHQIMHALSLKLWDLILSSRMLWDCLGCYRCQEHCPMNVRPADIIYQLKNLAIQRATFQYSQLPGDK